MTPTVRASAWTAGASLLAREGLLDVVRDAVPPATAELLRTGRPGSDWIDIVHFDAVTDALFDRGGEALVRRVGRLGGREAQLPPLRAMVRLLRALGAGPHVLLGRLGDLTRLQSRGVEAHHERRSERLAWVDFRYADQGLIPVSRLFGMAGRLESLLDLAGVSGTVDGPIDFRPDSIVAGFRLQW